MSRLFRAVRRLEDDARLDPAVEALAAAAPASLRSGAARDALGGAWLGHALHPLLTDFPLGTWMSASLLDLFAGPDARPASKRLVGFGLLAAVPTAAAGLSDWLQGTRREQRVGVVHAVTNSTALTLYGLSYLARRRGAHERAAALGVLGGVTATVGGYFGGHLSLARDTGLRATADVEGGDAGEPAPA